jgi:hypothetical protein
MEWREPMFLGQGLVDDIKLGMLGKHKGTNIDMAWLNFPILIKKMMNKNILFTTKDITKDVELGVHKTSLATMIFISSKYSLHFPS